jgi:hypothetical protein
MLAGAVKGLAGRLASRGVLSATSFLLPLPLLLGWGLAAGAAWASAAALPARAAACRREGGRL